MTDEELIEELCGTVGEIQGWAQDRIDYITKRRSVLLAKGEVIEDADEVEDELTYHNATIACCDRWFKKHGVEE